MLQCSFVLYMHVYVHKCKSHMYVSTYIQKSYIQKMYTHICVWLMYIRMHAHLFSTVLLKRLIHFYTVLTFVNYWYQIFVNCVNYELCYSVVKRWYCVLQCCVQLADWVLWSSWAVPTFSRPSLVTISSAGRPVTTCPTHLHRSLPTWAVWLGDNQTWWSFTS